MRCRYLIVSLILTVLSACSSQTQSTRMEEEENHTAKQQLQGMWLDDVTADPIFQIKGDTLYYSDPTLAPVAFKVLADTLKTYGSQTNSYHIEKQEEYTLWIQSVLGDILHLRKAENDIDSLSFQQTEELLANQPKKVIEKDHVVHYNNVRYRGYVYINPSNIKVVHPTLSEEGLEVDNVYYDNIIHICVFEGKKKLFAKDIRKQDFSGIVPNDFFQWAILSDMDFLEVNAKGYHYQATVCIPNGASCYLIDIYITTDGKITYELAD